MDNASQLDIDLPSLIPDEELAEVSGGMMMQYFYDEVGGGFCGVGVHDYERQVCYTDGVVRC